jgi:proliferating cell nuclear antigen
MRLKISDRGKQEIFAALFQLLKNWSGYVTLSFEVNRLYIQAMDKSHVCLASIVLSSSWFSEYECLSNTKISVDSGNLCILMNFSLKHEVIEFKFNDDSENLYISFLNSKDTDKDKKSYDHFFELALIDVDEDSLGIPVVDYDVEFTIETKRLVEVLGELNIFGSDLNIECSENKVDLSANSESAKLKINIPVDDLNEYAIAEGEQFNLSFSLNHICKMCTSVKLGLLVAVSLSNEYPMALKYSLGSEHDTAIFYVAPKVTD